MITMRRLFQQWTRRLQRHNGIGMGQIIRKGAGVQGQVVNKDQWGREGIIHCCVPFPAEKTCLFRSQFDQRWER